MWFVNKSSSNWAWVCSTVVLLLITHCLGRKDSVVQAIDVVPSVPDVDLLAQIDREISSSIDTVFNTQTCGTWPAEYTRLHSEMVKMSSKPKLLVAIPNLSGLADRIIGLASVSVFALLTNRAVQVGNRPELTNLEVAFTSTHVNWTRAQDPPWLIEPLKYKATTRNYNESVLASGLYYGVNTIDDIRLQDRFLRQDIEEIVGGKDVLTSFVSINRGKTIRIHENSHYADRLKNMGLTDYNTFGCMVNYLLKPKPEIFLPVMNQYNGLMRPISSSAVATTVATIAAAADSSSKAVPPPLVIGIHIRMGDAHHDKTHHVDVDSVGPFFQCAQEIEDWASKERKYSKVIYYLLTDSMKLRTSAIERYGIDKILTTLNHTIEHSAKEQSVCGDGADCSVSTLGYRTAAAEWWLLGLADYHVITKYSGFGRSAAFRGMKRDNVYTINVNKRGDPQWTSCNNQSFTSLEDMSYDWSGI